MVEFVVGVEPDAARAAEAAALLTELGADNATVLAAPLAEGAPKTGPYDAILIEGAVASLPSAITGQLKEGGRVACIWAEGALGVARVGTRTNGRISWRFAFNATAPVLPGFDAARAFVL
jgi:protein-L-isoaspartate(D-aspartate) O-methyltransferase